MLVRKQFKFEAAHTLVSAYSERCVDSIHGHSYLVEVVLAGEPKQEDGMVVDFSYVKAIIGSFVDAWDHAMVIAAADPIKEDLLKLMNKYDMRYIVTPFNPTAEEMSIYFSSVINTVLSNAGVTQYSLHSIKVHETTTGWAESGPVTATKEALLAVRFNHFDLAKLLDAATVIPRYNIKQKYEVSNGNDI